MLLLRLPLPLCKRLPSTDDRLTVPWIDDSLERGNDVVEELAEDRPESVCDGKTREARAALRRAVSRAVNFARFCAPQSSEAVSSGRCDVQWKSQRQRQITMIAVPRQWHHSLLGHASPPPPPGSTVGTSD